MACYDRGVRVVPFPEPLVGVDLDATPPVPLPGCGALPVTRVRTAGAKIAGLLFF